MLYDSLFLRILSLLDELLEVLCLELLRLLYLSFAMLVEEAREAVHLVLGSFRAYRVVTPREERVVRGRLK